MKLYNTLTSQKEEFKPISGQEVRLYSCGPTVYDVPHIGNLRTYIFNDVLKRTLITFGYTVKHVMNITDVDDKTIKRSGGEREKFKELTRKYEDIFFRNLDELHIIRPNVVTRATEYIDQMVAFVEDLLRLGYAYKGEDGSIYFSIEKFKDYGKLSNLDKEGIQVGARVSQDEYTKENPSDFALWKAWDESDGEIYWETPLGKGRPGWHIECSAMSQAELGETLDIHTGGVDNIFPHHENEIAQSEARSGKKFVNFWVHGEHLLVDNQKMAKSAGNFYTLVNIEDKGFVPLDFRYLVIGAHYRSKLNFTWEGLQAAKNSRERLMRLVADLPKGDKHNDEYLLKFKEMVGDDLNTPEGLALLWQMLRDESVAMDEKYATALLMDKVLGLRLDQPQKASEKAPDEIKKLAEERQIARQNRDFALADELRGKIELGGWQVIDKESGFELEKK